MNIVRGLTASLLLLATSSALAQQVVQITQGNQHDLDPRVSPDGNHLVYTSDRTGNFDVYKLTFGKAGEMQLTQTKEDDRYPSWSASGSHIIFNSKRTGGGDLYEMAADGGSGYLQLSDSPDLEEYASYAPKGEALVFAKAPKKVVKLRPQLSVVYAESKGNAGNPRVLAEGDEPRFSPDGKSLAFVSVRTKNKDVWLMQVDGGRQTQLTTDPKDDGNPSFSPDGKSIVFASKRTGNYDIWVMNTDGGNLRQLTTDPADEEQPCWSVGGYIYFTRSPSQSQTNIYRIPAP
ncbi:MAG: PD40 domain-containing protein [Candidatus Hydrogenedentes bacterium]|nr:PD40 domain-containing protein [Candidatus Hydrogenedentota bacterium]